MGGMGIFELPAMIEPDGSMGNLIVALVGIAITMILAFIVTMILYKEETPKQEEKETLITEKKQQESSENKMVKQLEIASPIKGTVLKLEKMKDDAFASGVLGKGAAIIPEEGNVYAPADGVITALFPTLHAIGMQADNGLELLIHIGLDTVQLNGEGFRAMVKQGDRVKKGQLLVTFDKEFIESKGFCLETPVLVTNSDDFLEVIETKQTEVSPGDCFITVLQ